MKALLATLSLLTAEPTTVIEPTDTLLHIDRVEITASLKSDEREPISATRLSMHRLEERGVSSVKELSALAPNFYQPDYGSSITSSIYVRGFGSRIDQPVLGMVVDDVVVMNKNAYDFDFYDVRSVELLRGPQGTLYGRNTSGGVMLIRTLQPLAWQGMRFMASMRHSPRLRHRWPTMPSPPRSLACRLLHSTRTMADTFAIHTPISSVIVEITALYA